VVHVGIVIILMGNLGAMTGFWVRNGSQWATFKFKTLWTLDGQRQIRLVLAGQSLLD